MCMLLMSNFENIRKILDNHENYNSLRMETLHFLKKNSVSISGYVETSLTYIV